MGVDDKESTKKDGRSRMDRSKNAEGEGKGKRGKTRTRKLKVNKINPKTKSNKKTFPTY
jgi:hypothetical protein